MKRKRNSINENSDIIKLLKRSAEQNVLNNNNNNAKSPKNINKKNELDEAMIKVIDDRMNSIIDLGIKIYRQKASINSYSEQLTYLVILKKICSSIEWKNKRIVSNKQQMKLVIEKEIIGKEERSESLKIIEKWIEYKISEFPGKFVSLKCKELERHYRYYLNSYGVDYDTLISKINDLTNKTQATNNLNESSISTATSVSSTFSTFIESVSIESIKQEEEEVQKCRLCGESNPLVIKLASYRRNVMFKDLIEYFCRIPLKTDDCLPQYCCINCKQTIDSFSNFTNKVKKYQDELNKSLLPTSSTSTVEIKREEVEYDAGSQISPSSNNESQSYNKMIEEDFVNDTNMITESNDFDESISDLLVEVTSMSKDAQSTKSSSKSRFNLSTVDVDSIVKPCSVRMERLPIVFFPSDDDDEEDEEEDITMIVNQTDEVFNTSKKQAMTKETDGILNLSILD